MNIFFLDADPVKAAEMHCDKHVCKMIIETAQMMSSVQARYGLENPPYKPTHQKHPSTLWSGDNTLHYAWLRALGLSLCREYTKRYNKIHKTEAIIKGLWSAPPGMPTGEWSNPPQCMPDECKMDDTVGAYRNYYVIAKAKFAKWAHATKAPQWWPLKKEFA
jgi:hypothetical protein